ncbi:MAG: FtsX-like permease family protein [Nocardioidaceae bacterium]
MTLLWLKGLLARRSGRLIATATGIAIAVALFASLGAFLTASKATMTQRAARSVAVDWQVAVAHPADATKVLKVLKSDPDTTATAVVGFAPTSGLTAHTGGTTQQTGSGTVVGIPSNYAQLFPGSLRTLAGTDHGVVVAQQTAANLHVQPGDQVRIARPGSKPFTVVVSGVVEMPQADSFFQTVGAPPQSQPTAPPDNVVLLPSDTFSTKYAGLASSRPDLIHTQIHVGRSDALPNDPASAYTSESGQAHNLEATTAGAGVVGDNLGTALGAAREDAAYSQVLFLFLGGPGAVLAGALSAAVSSSGATRRRREQAILRIRGASARQLRRLIAVETALTASLGGIVGLGVAALIGLTTFGSASFGAGSSSLFWAAVAVALGAVIAVAVIWWPARRDLAATSTVSALVTVPRRSRPRWLGYGLDLVLLATAALIFWLTGRNNNYALVLAPEGVPTISVNYWAFLAPALGWLGATLLAWRLSDALLSRGRGLVARVLRPAAGNLAGISASMMSRQRTVITRSVVLIGLSLAFAASTATFNSTYRQQAEADAQLTNGADVTVTESPGNAVPPSYATKLAGLPGVRSVEPLQHRFAYVGADLQDLYGINASTIGQATSLQDAYFQGASAATVLSRLSSTPNGVLVSAETVLDYQLKLGDLVRLRLVNSQSGQAVTVPFHYVGIVNEFPTAPRDSFLVANASYVAAQTGSNAVGTFLVNTGGSNTRAVAASVRQLVGTSATVTDISQARGLVGSSLTSVDLSGLSKIELGFALVLVAAAGGLVTGLGLTERRRSMAIVSALGASRRQLRRLSVGEPAFVVTIGLVVGAVVGGALSYLLVKILTGVFDPPPAHLAWPWLYLTLAVLGTVTAVVGAAVGVGKHVAGHVRDQLREL